MHLHHEIFFSGYCLYCSVNWLRYGDSLTIIQVDVSGSDIKKYLHFSGAASESSGFKGSRLERRILPKCLPMGRVLWKGKQTFWFACLRLFHFEDFACQIYLQSVGKPYYRQLDSEIRKLNCLPWTLGDLTIDLKLLKNSVGWLSLVCLSLIDDILHQIMFLSFAYKNTALRQGLRYWKEFYVYQLVAAFCSGLNPKWICNI